MFLWRIVENYSLIIVKYPLYSVHVSVSDCSVFNEADSEKTCHMKSTNSETLNRENKLRIKNMGSSAQTS